MKYLKILAIGDIIGRTGRNYLQSRIQGIKELHKIDMVIANGENAAGGISITPDKLNELYGMGIDVVTTGNHIWDKSDIQRVIDNEEYLLRPGNYPEINQGHGYTFFNCRGIKVCVVNLQGRVHMEPIDNPFKKFDEIYDLVKDEADIIVVDFHAEATSEKQAFGWYTDGRASAVFGTHTHVQTSDERILPGGTGFITDVGMTGSMDSVIGMDKDISIQKFITGIRVKYRVAADNPGINGIIFTILKSGKTAEVLRLRV